MSIDRFEWKVIQLLLTKNGVNNVSDCWIPGGSECNPGEIMEQIGTATREEDLQKTAPIGATLIIRMMIE